MPEAKKTARPSPKAQALAARLMAVQAVHQNFQNKKPAKELIQEYLSSRAGMDIEGERMVAPDGALFKAIVHGVEARFATLEEMILASYNKNNKDRTLESLLQSIMLCGAFELLAHSDIDAPIIINDYLNVTHGFFSKNEAGLVNGMLDSIAKIVRPTAG